METINFEGQNISEVPSAPKSPRNKRLIWAGIILAVLILAVIGWQYWQYTHSMYYQQMQAVKNLEKMAKESDKYGGKTPEETVALFRDAIKKGDFDLASKYGRPEVKSKLEKIKNDGNINLLIKDLETGKTEEGETGPQFVDLVVIELGKKYTVLSLSKSDGGTWKIVTF